MKYIVEYVQNDKPTGIFARPLEDYKFEFCDSPTLAGCPIKKSITKPRMLNNEANPNLPIYCFYLENGEDKDKFVVGEEIELVA